VMCKLPPAGDSFRRVGRILAAENAASARLVIRISKSFVGLVLQNFVDLGRMCSA